MSGTILLRGDFGPPFLQAMPNFQTKMHREGYDLSAFKIEKARASMLYDRGESRLYDYTVFIGSESFSIRFANDMDFLNYFAELCFSPEETSGSSVANPFVARHSNLLSRANASIARAAQWLASDVVSNQEIDTLNKEEPFHDQHRT